MRLLLLSVSLLFFISACRDKTQRGTIKLGEYIFKFPGDFTLAENGGIDSYAGRITGNNLWLGFDYGYYSDLIVETPQEFLKKGYWKMDAYSWFVNPEGKYTPDSARRIKLLNTRPLQPGDDSSKFKGADLIAVCELDSAKFDFGIALEKQIKQHRFITDTIRNYYRKIVIANDPKTGFTGIYLKDLHSYNENINGYLALSMATSNLTKQQQDSIVNVFVNVQIVNK